MSARSRRPVLIDLNWRPLSYGDHPDPISAILAGVKGEARRRMLRARLEEAEPGDIADLAREELTAFERQAWGNLHPAFMGGEYLPSLDGSVEIARIAMASVTQDVVSVRARKRGRRYEYVVVDEYPDLHDFLPKPATSTRPLTLGQLADLVTGLQLAGEGEVDFITQLLEMNSEFGGAESVAGFLWVESDIYPHLRSVVQERIDAIVARIAAAEAEARGEDGA